VAKKNTEFESSKYFKENVIINKQFSEKKNLPPSALGKKYFAINNDIF